MNWETIIGDYLSRQVKLTDDILLDETFHFSVSDLGEFLYFNPLCEVIGY